MSENNHTTSVANCQDHNPFDFLGERSQIKLPEGRERPPCGTMFNWYIKGETGKHARYLMMCGDFRTCPICHEQRKQKFQDRIAYARSRGIRVKGIALSRGNSEQLRKRLDKRDYLKLPAIDDKGNESGMLFFDASKAPDITTDDSLNIDWDNLTNTPKGKRPSGNLGKPEPEENEDGTKSEIAEITVDEVRVATEDEGLAEMAFDKAEQLTAYLDPKTIEEVQTAILQRTDAAIIEMEKLGIKILGRYHKKMKINISHIQWLSTSNKTVKDHYPPSTEPDNPPIFPT